MSEVTLVVLYPQPNDIDAFNADYEAHTALLRKNTGIPDGVTPYTITRFAPGPDGPAPFYQMFTMPFPSVAALQQVLDVVGIDTRKQLEPRQQRTLVVRIYGRRLLQRKILSKAETGIFALRRPPICRLARRICQIR